MDVTFVLEESGVSATVAVPCDVDVAAAKEVACTALAVLPASVEMRIGTQVLEETCRLQDTAFESGVQVVLAFPCADIRCPDEYKMEGEEKNISVSGLSLSRCGKLCFLLLSKFSSRERRICGFDTETFKPLFLFRVDDSARRPAISRCKTRCYLSCRDHFREVALPGGKVLRKVEGKSQSVFACGSVVVSQGKDGVSVYDEDLTLLRSLSHTGCEKVSVSHCGGWVITSSTAEYDTRVWDVNTGVDVACVPVGGCVAVSQSASAFAVGDSDGRVHLYDLSGASLGTFDVGEAGLGSVDMREAWDVNIIQFTPCGKYCVVGSYTIEQWRLDQYDVASMSCVRVITDCTTFAISPCSLVVVSFHPFRNSMMTRHLHPHNSE